MRCLKRCFEESWDTKTIMGKKYLELVKKMLKLTKNVEIVNKFEQSLNFLDCFIKKNL